MSLSIESADHDDNLKQHADRAVAEYLKVQPFYADLADVVSRIIRESIASRDIKIHSVQSRAKSADSFANKAAIPAERTPEEPKYKNPIQEITDLAGIRVITHFLSTLVDIDAMLIDEFEIVEKSNKGTLLIQSDRFGYRRAGYSFA